MKNESVHAFQGREKDYIVMTCVCSNKHQRILTCARIRNVFTRNAALLSCQTIWVSLLSHNIEEEYLRLYLHPRSELLLK